MNTIAQRAGRNGGDGGSNRTLGNEVAPTGLATESGIRRCVLVAGGLRHLLGFHRRSLLHAVVL
jgi:hypothetical protein